MRIIRISPPEWMTHAACRGSDADFFPPRKGSSQPARRVCADCDVQPDCLTYALADHGLVGIWGGTTEIERDRLRANRRGQ